jgi:rfaE bifunctional protein nucleotidyltransferase chain/domain
VRVPSRRSLSFEEARAFSKEVRKRGGIVVFTNGAFDVLHPGHVHSLKEARSLGDALVVGLNSDRSVRANKGPDRPINSAEARATVLLGLLVVDAVVVFDEDTPLDLISRIEPDVLVKGADWSADNIVGRDLVEARGGRVVRLDLTPGFSSTSLIQKTRAK